MGRKLSTGDFDDMFLEIYNFGMEKIKKLCATKTFKIFKWVFFILLIAYFVLVIYRVFFLFDQDKINAQVKIIHDTKLTVDDVMGKNLPPDPGALADKTVVGVDANNNGIRDDVELAVFKAYPNSAKTRAVLLQYALVLQKEIAQPFLNTETATAVAEEESRSYDCIGKIVSDGYGGIKEIDKYRSFVENIQFNTNERKKMKSSYELNVRSFELQSGCDVDVSKLLN